MVKAFEANNMLVTNQWFWPRWTRWPELYGDVALGGIGKVAYFVSVKLPIFVGLSRKVSERRAFACLPETFRENPRRLRRKEARHIHDQIGCEL